MCGGSLSLRVCDHTQPCTHSYVQYACGVTGGHGVWVGEQVLLRVCA